MRRLLVAAALLAGTFTGLGPAAPASAGLVVGACPSARGVTVVVNFGRYGGTSARCFTGATSSTTGLGALEGAGFSPQGTAAYGLAFICRINNLPPPSDEACVKTPPTTAYWSYWYAANGGPWTYSSRGAASHAVIVGGFEGWSFGNGSTPPTSGSPSRPAPAPTPQPTHQPTQQPTQQRTPQPTQRAAAAPGAAGSSPATGSAGRAGTPPAPGTSAAAGTATAPGSAVAGGSAAALAATGSTTGASAAGPAGGTAEGTAGGALPGDSQAPGQSPWPFAGAAGAIGLVLAGAAVVVRRRRRDSGG